LSRPNFDLVQLERVVERQREGANARSNAWVSASAGAGKTRVLRDRVLRLLMAGVSPERILCLTFTKAAAAEMARRINDELGSWTVAEDEGLHEKLEELFGVRQNEEALVQARRLFAWVLEAPGGMKIMTIHSLCQSILRRFPLEANVAPHFQVMEERDADEMLEAAKADLLAMASDDSTPLHDAMAEVAARVHEVGFPKLLGDIARARGKFADLFHEAGDVDGVAARLETFLGVAPGATEARVVQAACRDESLEMGDLRRVVLALADGSKDDKARALVIGDWLEVDAQTRAANLDTYTEAFFTKSSGDVRKTLATKAVLKGTPDAADVLGEEAARLLSMRESVRKASLLEANTALAHVAAALISRYEARKLAHGRLDYDDLIAKTRDLLRGEGAAAWVLFKLDGGIDHVLIDEAQDTNPEQWEVIGALVEEFFNGISGHDEIAEKLGMPERSVFAVGDVKQSIYSFQGAEPRRFEEMRAYLESRATAANRNWKEVELNFSFRSSRPVLEVVDKVFGTPASGVGVIAPGATLQHTALRDVDAGRVELWPPLVTDKPDEPEAWKPPVDPVSLPGAMEKLADLIAAQIEDWLKSGEVLESQGRPIREEDILILVRQRGAFVEGLVRALKARKVSVAGVDRMVLTEQIAVMDMLALGEFLLLPEDNLTLAIVLKSPLLGFDEDALFALAYNRGERSLWQTLIARRGESDAFEIAAAYLSDLLQRVDFERPYELFAGLLSRGGRERIFARLGPDAADPIDEFLSLALTFESSHIPSMQAFLHWVVAGQAQVKRDLDQTGGSVRVMTVHGAKGLEAPIVFLPDTTRVPRILPSLLWFEEGRVPYFIWLPRVKDADGVTLGLRDQARARRDEEYRRLLYVAMTRAKERLYVCGWNVPGEVSWYTLVEDAMEAIAQSVEVPLLQDAGFAEPYALRLRAEQRGPVALPSEVTQADVSPLPDWAHQTAPVEPSPPRPLVPSDPGEQPPVRAPIDIDGDQQRFARGNILHRLLQWLPGLDPDARARAAAQYLARPVFGLEKPDQVAISDEVLSVLHHSEFSHLFGPGSVAEVAVTGMVKLVDGSSHVISGQIDRLLVQDGGVSILDYKSNRPPPERAENVASVYLRQMAAYRHIIQEAWPEHEIRAYLLWTDAVRLMELPNSLLDSHPPGDGTTV
jgi:ATP-dependent helicase/nuclease subunit A